MRTAMRGLAAAVALLVVGVRRPPAWRRRPERRSPPTSSTRSRGAASARPTRAAAWTTSPSRACPGAPDAIFVGTASGGIFKSTNQGTSWTPVFDHAGAMMSIGDLAVAPSNPNLVWAGTGEANNRQSSSWGDGVYKSLDGGATWTSRGCATRTTSAAS